MNDDLMKFDISQSQPARIKVIGVGGGGGNAVNHMYSVGIHDVDFMVCNTDAQALAKSPIPKKIQLGTNGLGAGNKPDCGRDAALENIADIENALGRDTQMVFITAGMGGGTGTGAAPIIAKAASEMGILTIGIVTVPFRFEGKVRIEQAMKGINEMRQWVDSLLIINNDKVRELYGNLKQSEAFAKANNVLATAAKGIAEIITIHGEINVDFADVETVMKQSGVAIMGSAVASGPDRALHAIEEALTSPLLNNADIRGARNILLNITSGEEEITMDEMMEITDYIRDCVDGDANMIWGSVQDKSLGEELRVTIIATGFQVDELLDIAPAPARTTQKINLRETEPTKSEVLKLGQKQANQQTETRFEVKQQQIDFGVSGRSIESEPEISLINRPRTTAAQPSPRQPERPKQNQDEYGSRPFNWSEVRDLEDISEFETVPAYIRRGRKLSDVPPSEATNDAANEISRFTLRDNGNGGINLRSNNAYLHENID